MRSQTTSTAHAKVAWEHRNSNVDFWTDEEIVKFNIKARSCEDACPPEAIASDKQLVRGDVKWYVDFDKCLPFFNEHQGCAVCIAVCPWRDGSTTCTKSRTHLVATTL